jgi:hypothetical protein
VSGCETACCHQQCALLVSFAYCRPCVVADEAGCKQLCVMLGHGVTKWITETDGCSMYAAGCRRLSGVWLLCGKHALHSCCLFCSHPAWR